MFGKIAEIIGKLDGVVLMAAALGIVLLVFVIGLVFSFGGDLGKFKKVAKKVIASPTLATCNATAKELPIRARKQYKTVKQTGCKPDDAITPDACVYAPFKESVAAHLPGAVMAAGILAIFLSFFACGYVKNADTDMYIIPAAVTVGVMILRLAAGLISSAILKGGMKAYNGYVTALAKVLAGGGAAEAEHDEPAVSYEHAAPAEEPRAYDATFDAPERITVELADEEQEMRTVEPVVEQVAEPVAEAAPVVEASAESEAELKARARAEAMAAARAEQAAAQAAAAQAAAAQPAPEPTPQTVPQPQSAPQAAATSSADEVIARIAVIQRDGAPIATMKEVALALQKERAKPENKTPEMQRKLNEALAGLLKAMSSANKK